MERLDIKMAPERANIEAAIHFARYAIGKSLVKGKRVLDIACGEGYGSYLLKQAGAEYVVGVDVSSESITKATHLFSREGIEFKAADASSLETLFSANTFDVVVSVETIEHLADPASFIKDLKRVTKPDGVIVLTCPNDHWYYPKENQTNPYHQRKYRFNEFQKLSTEILGDNVRWGVGTGVFGFGSTPLSLKETYSPVPGSWMSYIDTSDSYLVSGENDLATSATQCSYFIGVWNAPHWPAGIAVFPLSMDDYASMVMAQDKKRSDLDVRDSIMSVNAELSKLQAEYDTLSTTLVQLEYDLQSEFREKRKIGLKWQATQSECDAIREALFSSNAEKSQLQAECENIRKALLQSNVEQSRLQAQCETYRVGYFRYVRISKLLPASLRSMIVKTVRFFRR